MSVNLKRILKQAGGLNKRNDTEEEEEEY